MAIQAVKKVLVERESEPTVPAASRSVASDPQVVSDDLAVVAAVATTTDEVESVPIAGNVAPILVRRAVTKDAPRRPAWIAEGPIRDRSVPLAAKASRHRHSPARVAQETSLPAAVGPIVAQISAMISVSLAAISVSLAATSASLAAISVSLAATSVSLAATSVSLAMNSVIAATSRDEIRKVSILLPLPLVMSRCAAVVHHRRPQREVHRNPVSAVAAVAVVEEAEGASARSRETTAAARFRKPSIPLIASVDPPALVQCPVNILVAQPALVRCPSMAHVDPQALGRFQSLSLQHTAVQPQVVVRKSGPKPSRLRAQTHRIVSWTARKRNQVPT